MLVPSISSPPLSASDLAKLYPTQIATSEKLWRDRYNFFKDQKKLVLRPRYKPDWKPSWVLTEQDPSYCEDSIVQIVCGVSTYNTYVNTIT